MKVDEVDLDDGYLNQESIQISCIQSEMETLPLVQPSL